MTEYIQVVTTTETKEQAQRIAQVVVEKRLAACAQIVGPISSTYWWKGKIETAEEWLCVLKSREYLYKDLEKAISESHPYEVPEIVAFHIAEGSQSYLDWMERVLLRTEGDLDNRESVELSKGAGILPFWLTEKKEIERALRLTGGHVGEAARKLHISQATLYRKIQKYRIQYGQ